MNNKNVMITGATDGLGKHVARVFASEGATVLLHGRNKEKGQAVLREIREAAGNDEIYYYNADFASLDEVRQLVEEIKAEQDRIDILINNAGIGSGKSESTREVSSDGYELRFQVNYLAGFLLTTGLSNLLHHSPQARVVNVASGAQQSLNFHDLMLESNYSGQRAYAQSKLAQVMFTFELDERLDNSNVTVNALHPATYMDTKMVREAGVDPQSSVGKGAEAVEYLAASHDLESISGKYFSGTEEAKANSQAYDEDARRQLWQRSEELIGVKATV